MPASEQHDDNTGGSSMYPHPNDHLTHVARVRERELYEATALEREVRRNRQPRPRWTTRLGRVIAGRVARLRTRLA